MKCIITTNHKSFEVIPIIHFKRNFISLKKQGRIHDNTVADGWAGAVVQKPLGIQKCYRMDRLTDQRTDRHGKVQSRVSVTKKNLAKSARLGPDVFLVNKKQMIK